MRLKDKVCVITGAAGGIGRATARRFLAEGATVVLCDRSQEQVEAVRQELAGGAQVVGHTVDVSQRETIDAMVKGVVQRHGGIDVLINNAGITADARLAKMSLTQWDQVVAVNLTGVFQCTQAIAEPMLARGGGAIVNTSSVAGVYGNFGQGNYAATKAGVVGLTKTWARELGPRGIRVNAVVPGAIETSILATVPAEVRERIMESCWLRRIGRPEEVATVYAFLASDEASYVNGAVVEVSGGVSL